MKKILYSLIITSALLTSCKDFLEPYSQKDFIPSDVSQLNELLLSALPDSDARLAQMLNVLSDDVKVVDYEPWNGSSSVNWYSHSTVTGAYQMYTWQPDYSQSSTEVGFNNYNMYDTSYGKLSSVNGVFDYLDRVSGSEEDKNWAAAQAHTLRAFYYLNLVNIYGEPYHAGRDGMGVALRTTSGLQQEEIVRSTVGQVYDLIESDLLAAVRLFETLDPDFQYLRHRATLPMALHLLARTYLYMERWADAASYAARLIEEWPQFQLKDLVALVESGITNLPFTGYTATGAYGNSMQRQRSQWFYDFYSYDNEEVIWAYGNLNAYTTLERYKFTGATETNNSLPYLLLASDSLVGLYNDKDMRLRTYLVRDLNSEKEYTNNASTTYETIPVNYRAYGKCKISNDGGYPKTNLCEPAGEAQYFAQAFRIGEAYLILAEAQAMIYKEYGSAEARDKSITALNTLLSKRIADYTMLGAGDFATADDLIKRVRVERRLELNFEGQRWFDLRRWGMPEVKHIWYNTSTGATETYILNESDPGYTIPLPHAVLENNSYMTQVPLYNGGADRQPTSSVPLP